MCFLGRLLDCWAELASCHNGYIMASHAHAAQLWFHSRCGHGSNLPRCLEPVQVTLRQTHVDKNGRDADYRDKSGFLLQPLARQTYAVERTTMSVIVPCLLLNSLPQAKTAAPGTNPDATVLPLQVFVTSTCEIP